MRLEQDDQQKRSTFAMVSYEDDDNGGDGSINIGGVCLRWLFTGGKFLR